jgi:hypothetical protein
MSLMKKILLTGIAALFLATGTAQAVEWQCGVGRWCELKFSVEPFNPLIRVSTPQGEVAQK